MFHNQYCTKIGKSLLCYDKHEIFLHCPHHITEWCCSLFVKPFSSERNLCFFFCFLLHRNICGIVILCADGSLHNRVGRRGGGLRGVQQMWWAIKQFRLITGGGEGGLFAVFTDSVINWLHSDHNLGLLCIWLFKPFTLPQTHKKARC